jgi:hypothetical protein
MNCAERERENCGEKERARCAGRVDSVALHFPRDCEETCAERHAEGTRGVARYRVVYSGTG